MKIYRNVKMMMIMLIAVVFLPIVVLSLDYAMETRREVEIHSGLIKERFILFGIDLSMRQYESEYHKIISNSLVEYKEEWLFDGYDRGIIDKLVWRNGHLNVQKNEGEISNLFNKFSYNYNIVIKKRDKEFLQRYVEEFSILMKNKDFDSAKVNGIISRMLDDYYVGEN